MQEGDPKTNLIWIDLEMTGLDTTRDTIIEVATIVTDKHLAEVAEGPVLAIGQFSGDIANCGIEFRRDFSLDLGEIGITRRECQAVAFLCSTGTDSATELSIWRRTYDRVTGTTAQIVRPRLSRRGLF